MTSTLFATNSEERVIAGVCAGIAQPLGVDVTLVRLVFALLALAGGAGILLYFALWAWSSGKRPWWSFVLLFVAGTALIRRVLPHRHAGSGSVNVGRGSSMLRLPRRTRLGYAAMLLQSPRCF